MNTFFLFISAYVAPYWISSRNIWWHHFTYRWTRWFNWWFYGSTYPSRIYWILVCYVTIICIIFIYTVNDFDEFLLSIFHFRDYLCRFDCGSGTGVVRSKETVILNQWNTVLIYRHRWDSWLILNQGNRVQGRSKVRIIMNSCFNFSFPYIQVINKNKNCCHAIFFSFSSFHLCRVYFHV